jgi:hypothetical protein
MQGNVGSLTACWSCHVSRSFRVPWGSRGFPEARNAVSTRKGFGSRYAVPRWYSTAEQEAAAEFRRTQPRYPVVSSTACCVEDQYSSQGVDGLVTRAHERVTPF